MKKENKKYQPYSIEDAPKSLEDTPFYSLKLDKDQQKFRDAIYDPKKLVIICNAKAGTGKTTVSVGVANILIQYGFYDGLIYITSPTMEQKQGYLPESQEDKNAPYMEPLIDALYSLDLNPNTVIKSDNNLNAIKEGTAFIEFTVDTYLRGCNFENKVVIIDEAQNFYGSELKKTLTRIHDNCKIIIIGHTEQCDIYKHPENSGFNQYLNAFEKIKDDERVEICELNINHRGWFSQFCDDVPIRG